jgi:1,2-phenylacetyl-CoA epoxidase catalytic subunit
MSTAQETYESWHTYAAHYNKHTDMPSLDWAFILARILRQFLSNGVTPHWTESEAQMFDHWCHMYKGIL